MEQQEKVCVTLLEWAQNLYDSYKEEWEYDPRNEMVTEICFPAE